jgi:hypothetical protein
VRSGVFALAEALRRPQARRRSGAMAKRNWLRNDSVSRHFRASRIVLLVALCLLSAVSCKGRDDREEIRNRYGPPDERVVQGTDPFWTETWYYYDRGVAYEFHRSAPRCGGDRDYYLYAEYILGPGGSIAKRKVVLPPEQGSETVLGP